MPKKKNTTDTPFTGKFNLKKFEEALTAIQEQYQIDADTTKELLIQSIDKAVRDTVYGTKSTYIKDDENNIVSSSNASAMHSETIIDDDTNEIRFFECKDVVEEVEDDLFQIEPDEAAELDNSREWKVGDVFKKEIMLTDLDYSFFVRAMADFTKRIKSATDQALIDKYADRIGQLVNATVESTDGKFTNLIINRVTTVLSPKGTIPGEAFIPGTTIKVLLKGIGGSEKKNEKGTTLLVTRCDDLFLQRLFEQEIPDLADGSVKIQKIAREAGLRAKVAVSSDDPNIDPSGACIGSDGSRIKNICSEIGDEKIDVIRFHTNPYLYIAEALKPATVVGVVLKDDEYLEEGKAPKAIAVVKNEESRIAIGKKGINVRLASKLTGYSIDIKEQDAAMSEHISYLNIDEIRRKEALELLDAEEALDTNEDYLDNDEVINDQDNNIPENEEVVDKPEVNEVSEEVENTPEEVEVPQQEEIKEEVKPMEVEHVEIKTKAKVSISELEAQIEEEKKKKNNDSSYKKFRKDDKKKEEKVENKPIVANAMPIYTEEELKEMDAENDEDNNDEEDSFEEYDDDHYYDDNK